MLGSGWTYNAPDDTPTSGPRIAAVSLTFTVIALAFVTLRWYVRLAVVKAVGCDDFLIVISWLGVCGYTICTVIQTRWGLGITSLDLMPQENVYNFGLLQFIGGPFYVVGIWGFKMSLLLSYLRFFPGGANRIATIIIATACTMGHIAFICVFIFLCTPIEKQYDPSIPLDVGHCVDAIAFYLSFSALTILFDVVIMLLPFPVIIRSQIQRRKKVVLLCLFVLGIFVTVIQAIRIQTIRNLVNYLDSAKTIEWSILEGDIGVIIACIPPLAPLIKYFAEKSRSSTTGGNGSQQKSGARYALHSWRAGARAGMQPLGTGVDHHQQQADDSASRVTKADDSTENILKPVGITKTTEFHISLTEDQTEVVHKTCKKKHQQPI